MILIEASLLILVWWMTFEALISKKQSNVSQVVTLIWKSSENHGVASLKGNKIMAERDNHQREMDAKQNIIRQVSISADQRTKNVSPKAKRRAHKGIHFQEEKHRNVCVLDPSPIKH